MFSDPKSLQQKLAAYPLARECEPLADGTFRITTPLLYPNGTRVELFYQPEMDLFASTRLTDKGQTAAMLAELQIYIEGYEKRQQILADICRTLRVADNHGELCVAVESDDHLPDAAMRLAQACVRAADLHYTQSFRAQSDFRQIFAAFLQTERPDSIEDYTIEGRFGRRIKVDFYTHQHDRPDNLVIALFSANETSSHPSRQRRVLPLVRPRTLQGKLPVSDRGRLVEQGVPAGGHQPRGERVAGAELPGGFRNVAQPAGDAVDSARWPTTFPCSKCVD